MLSVIVGHMVRKMKSMVLCFHIKASPVIADSILNPMYPKKHAMSKS